MLFKMLNGIFSQTCNFIGKEIKNIMCELSYKYP